VFFRFRINDRGDAICDARVSRARLRWKLMRVRKIRACACAGVAIAASPRGSRRGKRAFDCKTIARQRGEVPSLRWHA